MTEIATTTSDTTALAAAQRVAELDAVALAWLQEHKPDNTILAYQQDWKVWQRYCAEAEIPETTNTAGALIGFVLWVGYKINPDGPPAAPSTVERRLTGAVVGLRARGHDPNKADRAAATEALNIYKRELAEAGIKTGRGKSSPLTVQHLRAICTKLPHDTLAGLRDRALVLVAFAIAARRSEVAALLVDDIEPHDNGLRITVRTSKTGEPRTVAVPRATDPSSPTCPVRAWEAWAAAANLTDGPAFRRVTKDDTLLAAGLSGAAVGAVLQRAAKAAGLTGWFTGHSARSGHATEARRAGHDPKTISTTTGHSPTSRVLYEYMRIVDEWSDNSLNGMGL